jgi:sulfur-oxidizing protein SoxA
MPVPVPPTDRRSGFDFMQPATQAMQRDDVANPGMLSVADGERLWSLAVGDAGKACADCHGNARHSMRGVAVRLPAWDRRLERPTDLQQRINDCRASRQGAAPWPWEDARLLAVTAFVANQSRGMPITPDTDPRLEAARERGARLYRQRVGQLDFSCGDCHDSNAGRRLGGSVIPQAHPTGYPLYRLEWQALGSLQRRLRACMTGVRAEPFGYGSPELVELELFLQWRARGMPLETPAVRP